MRDDRRFLCDEMLAGLGRWLRIAGYDTAIAGRGCRDRALVEQARAEGRILLTRDRGVIQIRHARGQTVVLEGNAIETCARELTEHLGLDWNHDPLSRCPLCNVPLALADAHLLNSLPPRIRVQGPTVHVCPCCGRLYWEGSHVRRMRRRLAVFSRIGR